MREPQTTRPSRPLDPTLGMTSGRFLPRSSNPHHSPKRHNTIPCFPVSSAFVRHDGVVSQVKNQTHQLRFPASSLSRRKEITLKLDVTVDNVTDGLSVGVMDDVSRATGFATIRM